MKELTKPVSGACAPAGQAPPAGERAAAVELLRRAAGRKLHQEGKGHFDGIEYDFAKDAIVADLSESSRGFIFDVIIVFRQTNWDLDAQGARVSGPRNKDSTIVRRYDIREMESTGRLLGFAHTIASSMPDALGAPEMIRMSVADGELVIEAATIGYVDRFVAGDTHVPSATLSHGRLREEEGRLIWRDRRTNFDVDLDTLERTTVRDETTFEEIEIK